VGKRQMKSEMVIIIFRLILHGDALELYSINKSGISAKFAACNEKNPAPS